MPPHGFTQARGSGQHVGSQSLTGWATLGKELSLAELSFPEGDHLFRKKQSPSPGLAWVPCTALFLSHFALHFNCLIAY